MLLRKKAIVWSAVAICIAGLGFAAWLIREATIGRDNALFKLIRATPYGDKIGHAVLAAVLTFVLSFFLRFKSWRILRIPVPVGAIIAMALLGAEEASQYFVPTRELDIADALANLAGIVVVAIPIAFFSRRKSTQKETAKR